MRNENGRPAGQGQTSAEQQAMIKTIAAALNSAAKMREQNGPMVGMNVQEQREEVKTIDLIELFYHLLSKMIYIIIAAVIGAVFMGYTAGKSIPIYTATAKLYIVGEQAAASLITNLQLGSMLTPDYTEVFKTWEVHEMVRSELGLNYSYSAMQGMITVTIPEDTRVLYITVRNTDAQLAADIANAYAKAAKEFILQTMDTEEPNVFSVALVPSVGQVSNPTSRVMLGFMMGTVLACGLIVLRFVLDDRPRTPEDVIRVAGIPTLALIPAAKKSGLIRRRGSRKYEVH